MERDIAAQQLIDAEHLCLLRIGYYIAAATNSFFVFFPLIYVVVGMSFLFVPSNADNEARWVGIAFAAIGVGTIIVLQRPTVIALFERPEGA